MLVNHVKQTGQGMTEYIVITGLVAMAAIGIYMLLGSSVRLQTAAISSELAGDSRSGQEVMSQLSALTNQAMTLAAESVSLGGLLGGTGGSSPFSFSGEGSHGNSPHSGGFGGSAGVGSGSNGNGGGSNPNSYTNSSNPVVPSSQSTTGSSSSLSNSQMANTANVNVANNTPFNLNDFVPRNQSNNNSKDTGIGQCLMTAGNPINLGNGLKYQQEVDYLAANGFSLVRHYNSFGTEANWQHNWQSHMHRHGDSVSVVRSDGKRYLFQWRNNRWQSDADINDRLVAQINDKQQFTGWQYLTAEGLTESYSVDGKLLAIHNNNGLVSRLTYQDGLLTQISDPFGHKIELSYDRLARITQMVDPAGKKYQYHYDQHNNLQDVVYPDASRRIYHYEDVAYPHALTGISDELGNRFATWRYDTAGRAISSEHGDGLEKVSLTFNHDASTRVTDALGRQVTTRYQEIFGVKHSTGSDQPSGSGCAAAASHFSYDQRGNIVSRQDFNGNVSCYSYDARNLELYRVEGLAAGKNCPTDLASYQPVAIERKISTLWHEQLRKPVSIAMPLRRMNYVYDSRGNLVQTSTQATNDESGAQSFKAASNGAERVTQYRYNAQGLLASVDGARDDVADVVSYQYDPQGNLSKISNALQQTTQFADYDEHGRPGKVINANRQVITLKYDVRGRLLKLQQGAALTQYYYNAAGLLTQLDLPSGARYQYHYDVGHRLVAIVDALGNRIQYTLDKMGNRIQEQWYEGETLVTQQRREFDALNRVSKAINTLNESVNYAYDANGNLRKIDVTEQQLAFVKRYDALNRLIESIDPQEGKQQTSFNGLNQFVKKTDARGIATRYQRNAWGELTQLNSPDSGIAYGNYDAQGNLLSYTDANNQRSDYRYDALNRLLSIRYAGQTSWVNFSYDQGEFAVGRLSMMQDSTGTTQYRYNQFGQLSTEIRQHDSIQIETRYMHDKQGRLTDIVYPSGLHVHYQLDEFGRVVQILGDKQVLIDQINYFPFGGVKSFVYGAHGTQRYQRTHDKDGRLNSYTLSGTRYDLHYDRLSRIKGISRNGQEQARYQYDKAGRLIRYQQHGLQRFTYDANGNRISQTLGDNATIRYQYAKNSNRLLSMQVGSLRPEIFAYDATGQLTRDVSRNANYRYDAQGRLVQTITPQDTVNFALNAKGQRVYKSSRHGKVEYHYDAAGHLIAESAASRYQQEYVYLGNLLVAVKQAGHWYNVHNDHLNTPREITDSHGQLVWQWHNADPYGNNPPTVEKITFNHRFPGQYADVETGLNYNYHRDYDPRTGRYIQSDPLGLAAGMNTYAYVSANPLGLSDRFGLKERGFNPDVDPAREERQGTETPFYPEVPLPLQSAPYNCHSYAWHSTMGDAGDPGNVDLPPRWDNNPYNNMHNGTAQQLSPEEANEVGDIIVYGSDRNHNGRLDPEEIDHSAVVSEVDAEGYTIRATSKEGQGPLVEHHPSDQNPAYGNFKEWYRLKSTTPQP